MRSCLIITTYNSAEVLRFSLQSVLNQTVLPDEVVIADDGSSDHTDIVVKSFKERFKNKVIHSYQEDKGFRAAMSRNKAIAVSKSEYIIMIDGDMMLHKDFIKDHIKYAKRGFFLQGSRVLLKDELTKKILSKEKIDYRDFFSKKIGNHKNLLHLPVLTYFISLISKKSLKGIRTCNLSLFKEDIIKVNGFDESYEGWGREDSDFAQRLIKAGILRKDIKFAAIQFHLYHKEREHNTENDELLEKAMNENDFYCSDGIDKYLKENKN
ncbi:MAG: family 2 glycosyl transferase [Candidatus Muiribacterium halophilum]|uniref:Family 2 glycosyl transferase n=1 Tax=Muiribacterium halophilum TaxID=2053465 RepID=A0A2N5ZHE3_MUIH1|nr:MAG: family 2 glycosyl transferase [Candidatus Muirbacterium halophilum]